MDARRAGLKLAAIKGVIDAAKAAEAEVKSFLQTALDPGDRKNVTSGDASFATVSYAKASASAVVNDRAEFTKWVAANHPEEIHWPITLDAATLQRAMFLAGGPDHAAIMAAIDQAKPAVDAAHERHLLAECVKARAAVDTTTGEEIPGVAFIPGGQGTYISVRQSDEQKDALVQAWREGELDLLDLATTPLALDQVQS